jgi:NAD(P)H-dependent FMN reductase
VRAADGIILATPEYHGSFSGVLKNAIDLMGFEEFEGKMLGLVGVSGGRMGAFDALNTLRNVGRALHAWVVPQQVSLPEVSTVFDSEGRIRDNQTERRLRETGVQVARFARIHKSATAEQFLEEWQNAPDNPGGGGREAASNLDRPT